MSPSSGRPAAPRTIPLLPFNSPKAQSLPAPNPAARPGVSCQKRLAPLQEQEPAVIAPDLPEGSDVDPSVAVVGATGAVGELMRKVLEERAFPVRAIKFLASERSAGKAVPFRG